MQFSGFTVNGAVSFDYEIFPNGSCPVLNAANCGGAANSSGIYPNQPDFEFEAGSSTSVSPVTSFGTNGFQYGVTPSATGSDGSSTQAPNGTNVSPQYIGAWSGSLSNDTQLDFVDWPATIGVDNITVSWTPSGGQSQVPDPASVLLLGTAVAGIALRKKIRKTA
jgi:hypothetical protein